MKKYETIVILDEKRIDDDGTKFLKGIETVLTKEIGGTVIKSEIMGRRQFAREIKRKKTGIYLDIIHEMAADKVKILRDKYKLDETVLRLQSYTYDRPE